MPPTPRAPKPRVQAPKRRTGPTTDSPLRAKRTLLMMGVAAVVVALAALGAVALGGGDGDAEAAVRTAMEEAGCTLQVERAPRNVADHSDVASPDADVKSWNTDPPTAGPHFGVPAVYGSYTEPLEQARVVHNLEHGAVYIQYGDEVPEETVGQLRDFYDDHRNGTLLAPLPRLGDEIALGAWVTEDASTGLSDDRGRGFLATCKAFDSKAFGTFFDELQFRGPERFPADSLRPGS